jgi:hypothetical protein
MRGRANACPQPPAEARLAGRRPAAATWRCHTGTVRSAAGPAADWGRGTFAEAAGEVGCRRNGAAAVCSSAPRYGRRAPGSLPPDEKRRTPGRIPSRPRRPQRGRPARPPHSAPGTSRASVHHRGGSRPESGGSVSLSVAVLCHTFSGDLSPASSPGIPVGSRQSGRCRTSRTCYDRRSRHHHGGRHTPALRT